MASAAIEDIHNACEKLQALLTQLLCPAGSTPTLDAMLLAQLLESLALANEQVRKLPGELHDAALEKEVVRYRQNLAHLVHVLPSLHGNLLTEKARLEQARAHLEAAAAWAQASKKTL